MSIKEKDIRNNLHDLYHKKKYSEFLALMKEYINEFGVPESREALYFEYGKALATCFYKIAAIKVFEESRANGNWQANIELSRCYSSSPNLAPYNLDTAKNYLWEVIENYDDNAKAVESAYSALANVYLKALDYEAAIKIIEKGLKQFPNNVELLTFLGTIYIIKRDYKKAGTYFSIVLSIDSMKAISRIGLGICHMNLKNYTAALKQFKIHIKNNPFDYEGYLNLGKLYLMQDKIEEAKTALASALKFAVLKSDRAECLLELGNLYYKLKDYKKSEELYLEATELSIRIKGAFLGLYKVYQKTRREIDAKRMLSYLISLEEELAEPFLINEHERTLKETFKGKEKKTGNINM